MTWALRGLVLGLPVVTAFLAWKLSHDLAEASVQEAERRGEPPPPGWPPMPPLNPAPADGSPLTAERPRSWVRRGAGAAFGGAAAAGFLLGRRRPKRIVFEETKKR